MGLKAGSFWWACQGAGRSASRGRPAHAPRRGKEEWNGKGLKEEPMNGLAVMQAAGNRRICNMK